MGYNDCPVIHHIRFVINDAIYPRGGITIVYDWAEKKAGVAYCNATDNFCKRIGRQIATHRLEHEPLPVLDAVAEKYNAGDPQWLYSIVVNPWDNPVSYFIKILPWLNSLRELPSSPRRTIYVKAGREYIGKIVETTQGPRVSISLKRETPVL